MKTLIAFLCLTLTLSPTYSASDDGISNSGTGEGNKKVEQLLQDARNLKSLILSNLIFSEDDASESRAVLYEVAKNSMEISKESLTVFSETTQKRVQFLFLSAGMGSSNQQVRRKKDTVEYTDLREYNKALRLVSRLKEEYVSVLRQLSSLAPINFEFVYMVSQDIYIFMKRGRQEVPLISLQVANSLLRRSGRVVCPHADITSEKCAIYDRYLPDLEYYDFDFQRTKKLMDELNDGKGYDQTPFM